MRETRSRSRPFHQRLEDEHQRLEVTLADLEVALRAGDGDAVRARLATFEAGLVRYVRGEERVLFPVLESLFPRRFGPTARMRREHRSLRKLVAAVWESLARGDGSRGANLLGDLRSVFQLHIAKEELIVYPLLERVVSSAAEESLLEVIQ